MNKEIRDKNKMQIMCSNCNQIYSANNEMSNTVQSCPECGFTGYLGEIKNFMQDNSNNNTEPKFGKGKIAEYNMSLSQEERIMRASEAGKRSGEVRKRTANVKEAIETVMKLELEDEDEIKQELLRRGLQDTELYASTLSLIKQARNNPKAYETLVTMANQKPSEKWAVGVVDMQKSPEELKAFFGVGFEDSEGEGNDDE